MDLSIRFTTGNVTLVTFYATPLDSECKAILRHNWLTQNNLLIDWVTSSVSFQSPLQRKRTSLTSSSKLEPPAFIIISSPKPPLLYPDLPVTPGLINPLISLINAQAYACACKMGGSVEFHFQLHSPKQAATAQSSIVEDEQDLSGVPKEYNKFVDVSSKSKASTLPLHCEHDLIIELEEGAMPPLDPIYSLFPVELDTL